VYVDSPVMVLKYASRPPSSVNSFQPGRVHAVSCVAVFTQNASPSDSAFTHNLATTTTRNGNHATRTLSAQMPRRRLAQQRYGAADARHNGGTGDDTAGTARHHSKMVCKELTTRRRPQTQQRGRGERARREAPRRERPTPVTTHGQQRAVADTNKHTYV
jgi:hypothetical protein